MRAPALFSFGAAGFALLNTILTVALAGEAAFAHFTIDLAKLSLVSLLLEAVPSAYTIVRAQQDPDLKQDLASLVLPLSLLSAAVVLAMGMGGLFRPFSAWMPAYAVYQCLQQYLGVKLQAEGRMTEFFEQTFTAALLRALLVAAGLLIWPRGPAADVLWGALSIAALLSTAIWYVRHPAEAAPFVRGGHAQSLARLWRGRNAYYPYYANTALKRVRDSLMPILLGVLSADVHQVARYLLAFRGVEFVCGHLRIAEAMLNHIGTRLEMAKSRTRDFTLMAVIAQGAAFTASALMAVQTGLDRDILVLAFIASFFVYPYVMELVKRSDAYIELAPWRVTVSLTAFTLGIIAIIGGLAATGRMTAVMLILAPVVGQSLSALCYLATERIGRPQPAGARDR